MPKRDYNNLRVARYASPPGTCLHLHSAGLLTGYGRSRYTITPSHFGPHLVVRGHGTFCWPHGKAEVGVGTVFALLPGMSVDYRETPSEPWQYQWLHVAGSGASDFARGCGFTPERPVWRVDDLEPLWKAMRGLWECLDPEQPTEPYEIQAQLYAFSALSARVSGTLWTAGNEETLVDRARAVIGSQLHTAINVAEIAAILGVSRTTLFYAFRAETGVSPVQYLRNCRIGRARELLSTHRTLRLADIARACGFSSAKYFMRTFKLFTGRTPSDWRKAHWRGK